MLHAACIRCVMTWQKPCCCSLCGATCMTYTSCMARHLRDSLCFRLPFSKIYDPLYKENNYNHTITYLFAFAGFRRFVPQNNINDWCRITGAGDDGNSRHPGYAPLCKNHNRYLQGQQTTTHERHENTHHWMSTSEIGFPPFKNSGDFM